MRFYIIPNLSCSIMKAKAYTSQLGCRAFSTVQELKTTPKMKLDDPSFAAVPQDPERILCDLSIKKSVVRKLELQGYFVDVKDTSDFVENKYNICHDYDAIITSRTHTDTKPFLRLIRSTLYVTPTVDGHVSSSNLELFMNTLDRMTFGKGYSMKLSKLKTCADSETENQPTQEFALRSLTPYIKALGRLRTGMPSVSLLDYDLIVEAGSNAMVTRPEYLVALSRENTEIKNFKLVDITEDIRSVANNLIQH